MQVPDITQRYLINIILFKVCAWFVTIAGP